MGRRDASFVPLAGVPLNHAANCLGCQALFSGNLHVFQMRSESLFGDTIVKCSRQSKQHGIPCKVP
jgi:hypothetical protein